MGKTHKAKEVSSLMQRGENPAKYGDLNLDQDLGGKRAKAFDYGLLPLGKQPAPVPGDPRARREGECKTHTQPGAGQDSSPTGKLACQLGAKEEDSSRDGLPKLWERSEGKMRLQVARGKPETWVSPGTIHQ